MVESQQLPKLCVQNTFTGEKDEFVPVSPHEVTWYTCGPTVYDSSHMGHARTYISFDILRRVMTDYFGYNVKLVMNITDVDDKIIRKSAEANINFTEISRKYESEFLDDMALLNVRLPTVITRVSEYIPEIVQYIEQIIKNGYAYESNGSVYFDVDTFDASPDHCYNKLEQGASNDHERREEGEGVLTDETKQASEKRGNKDFALWKKSKPGEPTWESPWGEGRPGWHIECSAMAGAILPNPPIDIHTGGSDLKFPHHDNEVAQSEAYYECDNWVNNFWHTGRLNIEGLKMSKSLKNFITIKAILEKYNARQIRYVFLLHHWNAVMNYSDDTWGEAVAKEKTFSEFFRSVKAQTRGMNIKDSVQRWSEKDFALQAELDRTKKAVRVSLCDSFNTKQAILDLATLVSATNIYLQSDAVKVPLTMQVSHYVFDTLKAFGVYESGDLPSAEAAEGTGENVEDAITPVMNALSNFRDQIKRKANEGPKVMFQLSDEIRDDVLPFMGIKLEDKKQDQPSIWKFADKDSLLAERQAKIDKALAAAEAKRAKAELELKKKSTPGSEWFKVFPTNKDGVYSKFDADGLPTHNTKKKSETETEEKELSDAQRNGIRKLQKKQQGVYEKWVKAQEAEKAAAATDATAEPAQAATEEEKKE